MMESHNIMICPHCKLRVIAEEMNVHECRHEIERKIIRNVLWIFDGLHRYPLRLTPTKTHRAMNFCEGNNTPQNVSEDLLTTMNSINAQLYLEKSLITFPSDFHHLV